MPLGKKKIDDEQPIEVSTMDFDLAMKIVRGDILPANSKSGEYAQEASTAYKAIKKQCHIQPGSVKDAINVAKKEEAKRDDYLRGFVGMVNRLAGQTLLQFVGNDLVDRAESDSNVVPLERRDGGLATLGGDDFEEATHEELAQQEGRKDSEPEPGTAAEAMAAMKAKAEAEASE